MLNLLNTKASTQLQKGLLEEARVTTLLSVDYYLSTYSITADDEQTQYGKMILQCHARVSALMLRKIGGCYVNLGEELDDSGRTRAGNEMIAQSSKVLKLCRSTTTASPPRRLLHTPCTVERPDPVAL